MSAPSAIIRSACATAFAGSTKRPPSAKESGVKLRMPMTIGRRSASSRSSGCGAVGADSVRGAIFTAGALLRGCEVSSQRTTDDRRQTTDDRRQESATNVCSPSSVSVVCSIGYLQRQLLRFVDPAPHPSFRWKEPHQLVLLIGFPHRGGEFGDIAVLQFFDRVDADHVEQLGIILAYALDPHAVGE